MINIRSDLHSRTTPHTSPFRAIYRVSFLSYTKKNDREILRAHCIMLNGYHNSYNRVSWSAHMATYCPPAIIFVRRRTHIVFQHFILITLYCMLPFAVLPEECGKNIYKSVVSIAYGYREIYRYNHERFGASLYTTSVFDYQIYNKRYERAILTYSNFNKIGTCFCLDKCIF